MPKLWTLDEFDDQDSERAHHLRNTPSWSELIAAVRGALRAAVDTNDARYGVDESGRDHRDLRGVLQFPLGKPLFDWFFNGTTGYRAQFRLDRINGLAQNAQLIAQLAEELQHFGAADVMVHRYTSEFAYKNSFQDNIGRVATTLDPHLSKAWICEKQIGKTGQVQNLFVSRTGPKLLLTDTDHWWSFYPEDADGWLDIKGAFVPPTGQPYQLKAPEVRAATLEERGSA